jgi:hypothetical protein
LNKRILLKKIFFYVALTCFVVIASGTISVFLYKDRIIRHFINEANKHLNTPVQMEKISVSAFANFPAVTIVLENVRVDGSLHDRSIPLLDVKRIEFTFNPFQLYRGEYLIRNIIIEQGKANIVFDSNGLSNYNILKSQEEDPSSQSLSLDLKAILLEKIDFTYTDKKRNQEHSFAIQQMKAGFSTKEKVYYIQLFSKLECKKLLIGESPYFQNKEMVISSQLIYDENISKLTIRPSDISIMGSVFNTYGDIELAENTTLDLYVEGKRTNIQTLLSLLPETYSERFGAYRSKGEVYFDLSLKGEVSDTRNPALAIEFGLVNATLMYPPTNTKIDQCSFQGSFTMSSLANLREASLQLNNMEGILEGNPFKGQLHLTNFEDYRIKFQFAGLLETHSILGFYPIEGVREASGSLDIDIGFEGRLKDLEKKATAQKAVAQGQIEMRKIHFLLSKSAVPFDNLNGHLLFNNHDLALSNVSGKVGNSDFRLNGFFKNIITYLLFEGQPLGIESDLQANLIDMDELLSGNFGGSPDPMENKGSYTFKVSPLVQLSFNCKVKSLKFRRFKANDIKGDLRVKDQLVAANQIKLSTMGGNLELSGIMNARKPNHIELNSVANLQKIAIDSIFYVFEDFGQDFLTYKHLKGDIFAQVNFELALNENLALIPESLTADISTTIRQGQLNRFEPMQRLARYLDGETLDNLRFSDLKNDIHIENKTIYLPEMEVRSNASNIKVSGTHTFDQHIDYRVVAPMVNKKRKDTDEAFGAIEDDGAGNPKLHLRITGTTSDYKISYDTEAVKKKIVNDLKQEVQELKNAFKNKGVEKKKELKLSEEEYFEWDND